MKEDMNTNTLKDDALETAAGGISQSAVQNGAVYSTNKGQFAFRDNDGTWHKFDDPDAAVMSANKMFGGTTSILFHEKVYFRS